jgi:hypothetical protein
MEKYKAEGRTYKPVTGWSHPKDVVRKATPRASVTATDAKISDWHAEANRLKKEIAALAAIPDNINPNPIVDLTVEYEWDLKSGQYYRTLVSHHKNGGRSFKREPVSKREYNDWRY